MFSTNHIDPIDQTGDKIAYATLFVLLPHYRLFSQHSFYLKESFFFLQSPFPICISPSSFNNIPLSYFVPIPHISPSFLCLDQNAMKSVSLLVIFNIFSVGAVNADPVMIQNDINASSSAFYKAAQTVDDDVNKDCKALSDRLKLGSEIWQQTYETDRFMSIRGSKYLIDFSYGRKIDRFWNHIDDPTIDRSLSIPM